MIDPGSNSEASRSAEDIVFFTCADRRYEHFAPLYAASVLHHLSTASVELGLEDVDAFRRANPAMKLLEEAFPGRILLRNVDWTYEGRRIAPNSVRFMHQPLTRATWTYIGDIDIIFLDRLFFARHRPFMERTGLPYSNSVRSGSTRLTGLHFVHTESWYPLPDLQGLEPNYDEALLYQICLRKGLPVQADEFFRPQHGIHVSPNRSIDGWGVLHWRGPYLKFIDTDLFRALRPNLQAGTRSLIEEIDEEATEPAVLAEIRARLADSAWDVVARDQYIEHRTALINAKNYVAAVELGFRYLEQQPTNALAFHQTAWALAALKFFGEAVEHQRRAVALAPRRADFSAALRRYDFLASHGFDHGSSALESLVARSAE